jgi:hypothetical protein
MKLTPEKIDAFIAHLTKGIPKGELGRIIRKELTNEAKREGVTPNTTATDYNQHNWSRANEHDH